MKSIVSFFLMMIIISSVKLKAAEKFVSFNGGNFEWVKNGTACPFLVDVKEDKGVLRALDNLVNDVRHVTGTAPALLSELPENPVVIVGTIEHSRWIQSLLKTKKIPQADLVGKNEKYILTTVKKPFPGVNQAVVIAGSDKRGTIYGIYELSAQIGVSPWYYWADVPVHKQSTISIKDGIYTDGEPAVKYRGIFLNDEWPCLGNWAKDTFGGFNSKFYEKVFELVLRLKGNFMWPAMWASAFYDDDPKNGELANEMGIIMGTSHHEPMALAQQDWKRKGKGPWNYVTNRQNLNKFWESGIKRSDKWERVITVGMRGDGDEPMSEDANVNLLTGIVKEQRRIIRNVSGKKPADVPQVWALYKEVLDYYDKGMKVPEDITLLLCDDNWGNVRRLPSLKEKPRKGGYGMYYHVDYVGAPRNSKWLNVTPIQNMWEQLQLTYDYGVDRLWILNVGDLKPMEYPITLFLDMAWNPRRYTIENLLEHTRKFCTQQLGEKNADEAARLLNLYCKYAGRVTPEMLDSKTYNIRTGEWKNVMDDFIHLEAESLRQYLTLEPEYRDTYQQLILFPIQAMANLYEMYYAQAMNHLLYEERDPQANEWADKVEAAFKRDSLLCYNYNHVMSNGKWNHIMSQKHIGYTIWNDDFPKDKMPEVYRVPTGNQAAGKYVFTSDKGVVSIEAEHYYHAVNAGKAKWTILPYMGRTLSGVALMPYTQPVEGASLSYKMKIPDNVQNVTVHIVVKSTLDFLHKGGMEYLAGFEGGEEQKINFNSDLQDIPEFAYTVFYPTVARRVVEKQMTFRLPAAKDGVQTLILKPLDPGIVFEKIVVDCGGYQPSYLFMNESPKSRK